MNWQVFIAGPKGSGKTTLLHALVDANRLGWSGQPRRFVVWDSMKEWIPSDNVIVLSATEYTGEEACEMALQLAPCTFVCDEIDRVAPNTPGGMVQGSAICDVVQYGRHYGVALLAAARRSVRVHVDIRSQADTFFIFRHHEPRDLLWIREFCGQAISEQVARLPDHRFIKHEV